MASVSFYGASDGLVEVEGDVKGCDEYNTDKAEFTVIGENNTAAIVQVCYTKNGTWMIGAAPADGDLDMPTMAFLPPKNNYSAHLTVIGVKLVVPTCV